GAVAAGAGSIAPGHDPRAGGALRAALRAGQPPGAAHAAGDRGPGGGTRRGTPACRPGCIGARLGAGDVRRSDSRRRASDHARHRRRIGHRCNRHSTTKVMRRFTRHSVISPSGPVITLISLTHAPWMFLTVPAVFFSPERTASSTLVLDEDVISMTLAMAMADLPCVAGKIAGPARLRRPALTQRPERVSCYDPADESRAKPRARRPNGRGQVLDRQAPGQ